MPAGAREIALSCVQMAPQYDRRWSDRFANKEALVLRLAIALIRGELLVVWREENVPAGQPSVIDGVRPYSWTTQAKTLQGCD